MPNGGCGSSLRARRVWRNPHYTFLDADGLFEYRSIVLEQSFAGGRPAATLGCMSAERAAAVRTQYLARPGRRVIVVTDLSSLRGPSRGAVQLPLRLYWSGPSPVFDLSEPYLARWLYQIVLREASRPEDLTSYLDRDMLIALWPQLRLPRGVRQAWEERHPQLRAAAAGAA
jgi:hypothetical protein